MRTLTLTLIAATLALPLVAQQAPAPKTAKHKAKPAAAPKEAPLVPLNDRERAEQMLNRFSFGAKPGQLEQVLATGPDQWFAQQLNPQSIPDAALDKRLGDYPTLGMSPEQILTIFPNRNYIKQIVEGQRTAPTDPLLASVYEVQVYKYQQQQEKKQANGQPVPEPSDESKAEKKAQDQAKAAQIAGQLFALPKNQRMATLIKMPIPDRIAFTTGLAGDQRNLILGDFTPREREIFQVMASNVNAAGQAAQELSQAKFVRAILSERQLQEVMTDFWFNHFNIYIGKESDQWYTTPYERDAIRKNALGKFRDLLLATATSPAMMVYLDNFQSVGPNSIAGNNSAANPNAKKGVKGLNENYGREVMELHTVGVNGGYSQADVTQLASILTGWGVDRPQQGGPFVFEPRRHEPGAKQWYGETIPNTAPQDGMRQGIQALSSLAARPETAHFISFLLAQRFVADQPPPALVDRMAKTFLSSDGDIKAVLTTLAQSPEFNSKKYFRNKVKTPMEFLASAFRTTATDPVNTIKAMGMPLYYALPPTGYYITADQWMNTGALVERLNFAYQLTNNKFYNQKFDSGHVLALGLLAQPAGLQATASNRAKYTEAVETTTPPASAGGTDVVLHGLESALLGGSASAQTNELIHKQLAQQPATDTPNDTLNILTALVMGSPDFQLR